VYEHGGPSNEIPVVNLSSEEDIFPNTSRDEEFTRRLFDDLNCGLLGPPGDGNIIVFNDFDEEEVLDWKPPRTVHQVRSFLGLAGYGHRFILNFSKIANPITDLLKKEKFVWNAEHDEAFQTLKNLLTTSPVLAQPDIAKSFDVYFDASGMRLGCVLM
jgi:hypothetical protein